MGEHSFSKRLSLNVVLMTSILFIITIAIAAVSSHFLIAQEAEKSAEHLRDAAILQIENRMQQVEICVDNMGQYAASMTNGMDTGYDMTSKLISMNQTIVGSAVAYRSGYFDGVHYHSPYSWKDLSDGQIKSKQLGNEEYDYFSMEWYKHTYSTGEPHWSKPYEDEGGGGYLMTTYSSPVRDKSGEIMAVITADITLEYISEFLSTIKPYPSSIVSLVDTDGQFINEDLEIPEGIKVISGNGIPEKEGKMIYKYKGKTSFVVYGPLSNNWQLFITCDYKEVLSRASMMHLILILLGLAGITVLFIICYATMIKMTKPLSDLSDSALRIAEGDFNTQLPPYKYDDELGRLRGSFVFMQKSLNEYIENLKKTTSAKERYESELSIANHIQMAMLSTDFASIDKADLHAMLKPAREVGGDFYDFFTKDNLLYFAIGDVSGKGVPASLIMAITRSSFRFIAGMGLKMEEVVSNINDVLCNGNKEEMFVTLFVGRIDLETGEFDYCNAGHNPIIVNGEYLETEPNIAAALFEGFPFKSGRMMLPKGSDLLLYTDGVTEAERADKEEYGEERLIGTIRKLDGKDSGTICDEIYKDVQEFTAGNSQNDDLTIMNIKLQ